MNVQTLLQELSTMTHAQRMRRMVQLGQAARSDAETAQIIKELEQGDVYQRRLALSTCSGSNDSAHVLRALADPSRAMRTLATGLISSLCDDDQVAISLHALPIPAQQRVFIDLIARHRRTAIDGYLVTLVDTQPQTFVALLGYGSADFVARYLPEVIERVGYVEIKRLARHHPLLILSLLQQQAEQITQRDQRLIYLAQAVLRITSDKHPAESLDLIKVLLRFAQPSLFDLTDIARRLPSVVADLILHSEAMLPASFDAVAEKLDQVQLTALLLNNRITLNAWQPRYGYGYRDAIRWFRRLSPDRRAALYAMFGNGWQSSEGIIALELIRALPRALRESEARRHWMLPALQTRPMMRLPYASFLSWTEAQALLMPFVRDPDPELRTAAISALIETARYERLALPELLTIIRARRNEQDPVRLAMIAGLQNLPPGIWRAEHLDDLGQIIREALNAADLSTATAQAAEKLIVALLPNHSEWGAAWLATLVQERGQMSLYDLEKRLSWADARRLNLILLPVFQTWMIHERENQLISAARNLGKRLIGFDGLIGLLEQLIRTTKHASTASLIVTMLGKQKHYDLEGLVVHLLKEDASWGTQPVVYLLLHRQRQDLLTPYLGQNAFSGKFSTGKTRFVPNFPGAFFRWIPEQQAIFAETLRQVAGDTVRDTPAVISTLHQLAGLLYITPGRLIALASDPRQPVRESALRVLGRLDGGEGIPLLIEAMGDDRGRVAIYALRSALLEMPAARALAILRAMPTNKVTIAKEVIRLIGEQHSAEAYQDLLAINERDLHRDARVALLRALWDYLEYEPTWTLFIQAAQSGEAAMARTIGRIPAERTSDSSRQRLVTLLASLIQHRDPLVQLDVVQRCADLPVSDPAQTLLLPLIEAISSPLPDVAGAAARAIFATYAGQNAEMVGRIFDQVRPNRRALSQLRSTLQQSLIQDRLYYLPAVRAALRALESDAMTAALRVDLAIQALYPDELTALLAHLAESRELHADALAAAERAIQPIVRPAAEWEQIESVLAVSPDRYVRRLALSALVAAAGSPEGWTTERRARLETYRHDMAPLVAEAAQFTFPPDQTTVDSLQY